MQGTTARVFVAVLPFRKFVLFEHWDCAWVVECDRLYFATVRQPYRTFGVVVPRVQKTVVGPFAGPPKSDAFHTRVILTKNVRKTLILQNSSPCLLSLITQFKNTL